jgi:hypothetical protein
MTIENYLNIDGVEMVLVIDQDNNCASSMLKSTYDEMIEAQNADKL